MTPVVKPPPAVPVATVAFDRLAHDYDRLAAGDLFRLLRQRTHATFARLIDPGSRVLEIGCGTGLDTVFLAGHGCRVVACDPSEEMVSRALCRLARHGLDDRATVVPCGLQDAAAFVDALTAPGPFDAIVSNFGALNCVEHLAPLGALVHRSVRDGGAIILGLMGRACAAEAVYFLLTGRPSLVTRRRGHGAVPVPVAGLAVPTFYHRIDDVRRALGPYVDRIRVEGIGVALPPPYFEARWRRLPVAIQRVASGVDRLVAPWPPFNRLGDHVLVRCRKKPVVRPALVEDAGRHV